MDKAMRVLGLVLALGLLLSGLWSSTSLAQAPAEPTVKSLPSPEDPTQKTVLIGRSLAGGMIIQLELEPAKAMGMQMGTPPMWMEQAVAPGELYHVEVKPVDPASGARISFANVMFMATNRDNGRKVEGMLHPMWGGSGLHYAINSGLAGDGTYEAMVTVGVPTFSRDAKDKTLWMQPATVKFHFKLVGGKLTEVSQPTAEVPPSKEAVKAPGTSAELPADPSKKTAFIASVETGGMVLQLELEPAKAMWMQMGTPPMWMEQPVAPGELYHVEVKPVDPKSNTRLSFTSVMFMATNRDNGRKVEGMLHAMWGGSGLHYAMNSALAGDGTYEAMATVGVPTFSRDLKDMTRWMQPVTAKFTFKLSGGQVVQAGPAELKLPEGAVKLTDTFPAMGEHWAVPKDMPLGPIYLVWQGKVIGVEYMWNPPMMKQAPAPPPEVVYQIADLPLFGRKIDHYSVHYFYPGHPGFEQAHYDTHFFFISPEERFKIGPPGQAVPAAATGAPSGAVPQGAIQLSPTVPAMGEHWGLPPQLPFGPIYLVEKGKVHGWEHMWNHDPLKGGKVTTPEGESWIYGIDVIPVGQAVDHITIEYLPKGHPGYEVWHYDVHLYSISPKDRVAIK